MKKTILAAVTWMGLYGAAALADGTPRIQFDQTHYDFGKISQVTAVSGVFKFKNTGDAILKLQPPKPSCGCTVAALEPDTLAPGATGQLSFTLNLGVSRASLEKQITVQSNDPKTPIIPLTIKVDYTPLYELTPLTLSPCLAFGANETNQATTLTRTDGKPLQITKLDTSKPWITATVEPSTQADASTAHILVTIQRNGPPRHFNEYVHVYAGEQTKTPVASIYLYGEVMGEVALSPESLYWSIVGAPQATAAGAEAQITRRVTIRSASGQTIELTNPQSSIKGIKVELVPKEPGKVYELIARLDDVPPATIAGNVSFETSVASQSRIVLPVIVNVFKP